MKEQLQAEFADVELARRIYFFPEIASTSDWAKKLVERAGPRADLHGTVILAEHQTAGRGRHNRQWVAPQGKALLFSIILAGRHAPRLGMAVPVAVCDAIRFVTGVEAGIKYPNDILIGRRKVGGILLEAVGSGPNPYVVAGIGVNCHQTPEELPPNPRLAATSLRIECDHEIRVSALAAAIIRCLAPLLDDDSPARVHSRMSALCVTIGRIVEITTPTEEFGGTALAITSDGALLVRTDSGMQRLVYSGDVRQLTMGHASDT